MEIIENEKTLNRVLVTGGAGYIGSVLSEQLLSSGYRVTALDNLLYRQNSLFHLCHNANFEFIFGDARNEDLIREQVRKNDILIPLAAVVGAPACSQDPPLAKSLNFDAIKLLNDLRSRDQLVIYPTTNSGYGTKSGDVYCTEETPLEPISLYGQTKSEAEDLLLHSPNAITLRLATVFGVSPRMRLDLLVNDFVYKAVTDRSIVVFEKDFKRNFVHIRDVSDCFLFGIANYQKMVGRPFNVGLDSANMSKEELALKIKDHLPDFEIYYSQTGQDPDKRNYIISNQRLKKTGFEAKHSLDEGIEELIKGYKMLKRQPFTNL